MIAAMEHLEVLDLTGTSDGGGRVIRPLTLDHLKIIARMKSLKALSLEFCFDRIGVPADALIELGPLQELIYLNLGRNNLRDGALRGLCELKNLQGLNLRFTLVKGAA